MLVVVPYLKEIEVMDWTAAYHRDMSFISEETFRLLPMLRMWCLVEIFAAMKQIGMVMVMKVGRLKVQQDSLGGYCFDSQNIDLFLKKLFWVVNVAEAKCVVEADRVRILAEHKDELELVNAKVRGFCAASIAEKEDSTSTSLVSCAAMGDSGALAKVKMATNAERRRSYLRVCAGQGFTGLLRELLEIFPSNDRENGLLVAAARGGHVHCIKQLLDEKIDINSSDVDGSTACMSAAGGGQIECLRLLIDAGADVCAADSRGKTACMMAAGGGHVECLRLLLEAGSDMDAVDEDGNTACVLSAVVDHVGCVKLLMRAGCDDLITASSRGALVNCVKQLLEVIFIWCRYIRRDT